VDHAGHPRAASTGRHRTTPDFAARRRAVTSVDALIVIAPSLTAVVLAAVLGGPRLLCWLLGHEVGSARTECAPAAGGRVLLVRVSRCVRCRHPFTD
jgi:hypothetical protein